MDGEVEIHTESFELAWLLGFVGFLSFLGFRAFLVHDPVELFWFGFAGFFSFFRFRYEPLKYVGWLGILGLELAGLGVLGFVSV